ARAALDASAFQTADVVAAMEVPVPVLRADGGATRNAWLMQFQADILGLPVEVAGDSEITALRAAALAAPAVGRWSGRGEVAASWPLGGRYEPQMSGDEAAE